jgi:hypothetical protein
MVSVLKAGIQPTQSFYNQFTVYSGIHLHFTVILSVQWIFLGSMDFSKDYHAGVKVGYSG